jgi:hypothetical protein
VNDDLTGASANPHPLGIIAKLLVILLLAGGVFVVIVGTCRVLNFL